MDQNGYCMICPKRCKWDQHKNRNYILEETLEEKIIILEDLKKRFFECKNELNIKLSLFEDAKGELNNIYSEFIEIQELIYLNLEKLQKIALKKEIQSDEEYFNVLIEVEKSEHKTGWQNRIRFLETLKERKKLLTEIYKDTNFQMNQIKDFIDYELHCFEDNIIK